MDLYDQENTQVIKQILDRTFFSGWKLENKFKPEFMNYKHMEFILNDHCDQRCSYCYLTRFGDKIMPHDIVGDKQKVLENAKKVLRWLRRNDYYPNISIFLGETLSHDLGYKILDEIIDFYSDGKQMDSQPEITIASNMNFVRSERFINEFKRCRGTANSQGINLWVSASIDGIYMDDTNRPYRNPNLSHDLTFYDKVFKFAHEYSTGFHPMIYSNKIDQWILNFEWFIQKFKEYDLPWKYLYLLEVRNYDWTPQQVSEYYKFMRYVLNWLYNKTTSEGDNFIDDIIFGKDYSKGLNIVTPFFSSGRGIGCSIQSCVQTRLADLSIFPCHRLMYPQLLLWKFKENESKTEIEDIMGINPSLYIALQSSEYKNFPYCQDCTINTLCGGQCLGSQYEMSGDLFIPTPTVCSLEHAKISALLDEMESLGLIEKIIKRLGTNKQDQIRKYFELRNEIRKGRSL